MVWIDWVLLALLAISAVVGLWRGLVFELMSLAGWVVAYFLAHWLSPQIAPHIPVGMAGSALNSSTTFLVTFVAVLIVWALLARLVRMLVRATPLSIVDRLLGLVFGSLRGLMVALMFYTVVSWTPWSRSEVWTQSQLRPWLAGAYGVVQPLLPASWVQRAQASTHSASGAIRG
jgi:membrane protein required for colicin V production